jgi:hypothetical protein
MVLTITVLKIKMYITSTKIEKVHFYSSFITVYVQNVYLQEHLHSATVQTTSAVVSDASTAV